jgi:hypothetical protein
MEEIFDPAPPGYIRCGCCEEAKRKSEFSKSQLAKIKKKQKLANCLECVSDATGLSILSPRSRFAKH